MAWGIEYRHGVARLQAIREGLSVVDRYLVRSFFANRMAVLYFRQVDESLLDPRTNADSRGGKRLGFRTSRSACLLPRGAPQRRGPAWRAASAYLLSLGDPLSVQLRLYSLADFSAVGRGLAEVSRSRRH